jgi:hypothetical protein
MSVPAAPDPTAVRVALWRALHVEVDAPPPVVEDTIGLKLAAPDEGWRQRPDMHPEGTRLVPGVDRRARPLHRGSGRRADGARRRPVRAAGRRPR